MWFSICSSFYVCKSKARPQEVNICVKYKQDIIVPRPPLASHLLLLSSFNELQLSSVIKSARLRPGESQYISSYWIVVTPVSSILCPVTALSLGNDTVSKILHRIAELSKYFSFKVRHRVISDWRDSAQSQLEVRPSFVTATWISLERKDSEWAFKMCIWRSLELITYTDRRCVYNEDLLGIHD